MGRPCSPVTTVPCIALLGGTTAPLALHTDTISWWRWPDHLKGRLPGQGNCLSEIHVVNFFASTKQCCTVISGMLRGAGLGMLHSSPSILWKGMLWKSNQMLQAGSAVGQCALNSSVRTVGHSPGFAPEYRNWDCSSWRYVSEASWRASSKIPEGLTLCSNFNRAALFLALQIF